MTLRCKVSGLDYYDRNLYFWKWKFNGYVIQESGKYNMKYNIDPYNWCLQSTVLMSLRIKKFSKQDFGQYKCGVLSSNAVLGQDDISVWGTGKADLYNYKNIYNKQINK